MSGRRLSKDQIVPSWTPRQIHTTTARRHAWPVVLIFSIKKPFKSLYAVKAAPKAFCAESFVAPITSDFRFFVPLVFRALGQEKILRIVEQARSELKLGEQEPAWREAAKYIVGWSDEQIEAYKAQK